MAKLRHIAMAVKDPEASAKFYEDTFGLKRVGETDSDLATGLYLSDGVVCLALLNYKTDEAAGLGEVNGEHVRRCSLHDLHGILW